MNFILVPLHTGTLETSSYSDNTIFYVYAAFFNVLLTYGMETAFFRYFSKSKEQGKVYATVLISLISTTLIFLSVVLLFSDQLSSWFGLQQSYFNLLVGVLVLDTLVVAPFAYLRATGKPIRFSAIKLSNIAIYVGLNFFFLWAIPQFKLEYQWYQENDLVQYIFIANLCASIATLLLLIPYFLKFKWQFDRNIFKQLINYSWPIMVAGLAYVVNENFDKWLIPDLLGRDINGAYSGCYKIAVFMTIFIQAFRLGAEPFFFNYSKERNAKETYAIIMKFFVIFGSFIFLLILAYLDFFKELLVKDESYWIAMDIVPIVLLANLCLGIYFNLAIWYKLTDKTRFGMYISLIGAIITIGLNYAMIPKFGFIAAAWTTLAAYGSMMIISYLLGQKYYKVPYEIFRIGIYLVLTIGLGLLILFKENQDYLLNTGILLIFIITATIFEKPTLKRLINTKYDH